MLFFLDTERPAFPDAALADDDGLLAIGGRLTVDWLLEAYRNGIFPWFEDGDPILWHSPPERFVLFPEHVTVSKSMRKVLEKRTFEIRFDTAFEAVIDACATIGRNGRHDTWITRDMRDAYIELHRAGYAHSAEAWREGRLCGGLYGVAINGIFCGESMFSRESDASKAALLTLCRERSYRLIDCQVYTAHLASLGAVLIPRHEFLRLLR